MSQGTLSLIVFAVAFLSGFTQTITGFGYAIIMMAILPFVLPSSLCALISIIGACGNCIWMLYSSWSYFRFKAVILTAFFSAVGILAGLVFGIGLSSAIYMRILGIFLIVLSAWMWKLSSKIKIRVNAWTCAAAGIISGAITALFAVGGPPLVLYYNSASEDKETYMASLQGALIVQFFTILAVRAAMGLWPPETCKYLIPLAAGTFLGVIPGKAVYSRFDSSTFRKFIYLFMCLAGAFMALTA